ncbi:MAG: hypothetical protein HY910_02155 [Desulfarculus sp.]|nr:hypothetical protein [Desulfarculus sp.]
MESPPSPPRKEPVRLDAWVAASLPNLGPARRNILMMAAELTADGSWVPSSQIKEHFGAQRQPVNRHLRALQADGLVLLDNRGRGLPLYVKVTAAGRRALGLRGPQRPAESLAEVSPALETASAPAADPEPATVPPPSPATNGQPAAPSRGERFAQNLYESLRPFLRGLEYQDFRRLLMQTLAEALGRVPAGQIAAPSQPQQPAALLLRQVIPLAPEPQPAAPAVEVLAPAQTLPALGAAEEALEERLNVSCHPERRDEPWWERTREFSTLWDQIARWRLGSLGTSFTTFGPRWQHPEWNNFNRARRQADARGARYLDWIQAQFDRLNGPVVPSELHGEEALAAWHKKVASQGGLPGPAPLGPAPYTIDSFNAHNPDHVAHAEELLGQITSLAYRVYGQELDGPIRLLTQAIAGGNLPEGALDLRPQWKDRVLAALGRQTAYQAAPAAPQPPAAPRPGVYGPAKVAPNKALII